jgi:penicillin-binding protein 2
MKLGIERMATWLHAFGFGEAVGMPLTTRTGLVPTPDWKKERNMHWVPGDTVITGIGQGALLTTPLHAALAVARLSQSGHGYALRLDTNAPIQPLPTVKGSIASYSTILHAMRHVITAPDGTAHALHNLPFPLAAKTGTAQVVSLNRHNKKRMHEDHHWLIGFAPADNPRIAFAILVEHEHVALHVARSFLQEWWLTDTSDSAKAN